MAQGTAAPEVRFDLHRGQQVIAGTEDIGEILDVHVRDGVRYLHILRFGPGGDEIYVPTIAVRQVVGNHVYLGVTTADLLGKAWHERPDPPGG